MPQQNLTARVTTYGLLQGRTVQTEYNWFAEDAVADATSQSLADEFYTTYWSVLKTLLTNRFRMVEIRAEIFQIPATLSKPTYIRFVDEPGDIDDSESMPAFNTINIFKVPDNTTIWPTDAPLFGLGWNGFSGFPENVTNNGVLIGAAAPDWNAYGELMETINFGTGTGEVDAVLGMWRWHDGIVDNGTDKVLVAETYSGQKIGSRLSRKLR